MAVNDNSDMGESLRDQLTWRGNEYDLVEFLDIFPLPQVVQVAEGNYGVSEETTLPSGQILTLHVQKQTKLLRGYTYEGVEVTMPLNCPQKVEVRPQNVSLMYDTVGELCTVLKDVKFVRVTKDNIDTKVLERNLMAGQKLKLLNIDNASSLPLLICTDEEGCELCLPMYVNGGFQPLRDNKEYFLVEVVEIFPLPLYVQFIASPHINANTTTTFDKPLPSGLIQIDDLIVDTTVIASAREENGRKCILTFPRTLDVSLMIPEQALTNDETYARVCKTLNDGVDLVKIEKIALKNDEVIYGTRSQLVREFSYNRFASSFKTQDPTNVPSQTLPATSVEHNDDGSYIDCEKYEVIDEAFVKKAMELKAKGGDATQHETSEGHYEDVDHISKPPQLPQDESDYQEQSHQAKCFIMSQTTQDIRDVNSITVPDMGVREIVALLGELNMNEYGAIFEREQVDGAMLKALDKHILQNKPFHMSAFHALKLTRATEKNWRPNK